MNELLYRIALSQATGVGSITARQLISYCGSAQEVFMAPIGKIRKIPGIRDEQVLSGLKDHTLLERAEKILSSCLKYNIEIHFISDPSYPKRLKEIDDAPLLLYAKGNIESDHAKTIAVVGTRMATAYGKQCLEDILQDLVSWNPTVVSGLAYGIDITAHKLCLDLGLKTIGVLGSGINRIYPALHQTIAQQMCEQGGLISEYPPNTKAEMYHFPARNRIIAGLCDAVLVAEAGEKGGALITAQLANSYHREVMAIPGNVQVPTSSGCNNLIKNNQAHLITSGKDMAEWLNWDIALPTASKFKLKDIQLIESLSPEELALYEIIEQQQDIQIDDLAWKSNTPISKIANLLLQLEMTNLIRILPGKKIRIT